jgi:hypothetical protein
VADQRFAIDLRSALHDCAWRHERLGVYASGTLRIKCFSRPTSRQLQRDMGHPNLVAPPTVKPRALSTSGLLRPHPRSDCVVGSLSFRQTRMVLRKSPTPVWTWKPANQEKRSTRRYPSTASASMRSSPGMLRIQCFGRPTSRQLQRDMGHPNFVAPPTAKPRALSISGLLRPHPRSDCVVFGRRDWYLD